MSATTTIPVVDGVPQVPAGYAIDQIVEVHAEVRDADGNLIPQEG